METPLSWHARRIHPRFLPYLWGMETLSWGASNLIIVPVLTVPMRNGNTGFNIAIPVLRFVLTVPMRNGNTSTTFRTYPTSKFLPYLWGMETWFVPVSCFWASPFLPYLWGMETSKFLKTIQGVSGSYRTYEEWKPKWWRFRRLTWVSSYRTYEEWKL